MAVGMSTAAGASRSTGNPEWPESLCIASGAEMGLVSSGCRQRSQRWQEAGEAAGWCTDLPQILAQLGSGQGTTRQRDHGGRKKGHEDITSVNITSFGSNDALLMRHQNGACDAAGRPPQRAWRCADGATEIGSIFGAFARAGQRPVNVTHRAHTNTEARANIVQWVTESTRSTHLVNDRGFRTLMTAGGIIGTNILFCLRLRWITSVFIPLPSPLSVSFPMAAVSSNLLGTACLPHLSTESCAWGLGVVAT
ncbi:hypothetical protein FB451DRAFT_1380245 [Mycena latifolia]|nr:hypothetical protein FB451DRAFT_1380245 [Mycena latifolia]